MTKSSIGVIRRDVAYDLTAVKAQLDIGTAALRKMRRDGLPVRRVGRKSWVLGKDLLNHIESQGKVVACSGSAP